MLEFLSRPFFLFLITTFLCPGWGALPHVHVGQPHSWGNGHPHLKMHGTAHQSYGLNQEVALVSCARAYRNPWLYALMPTSPKIRSIVAIKVLRFNYYILLLLRVRGFEPSTITSELFPQIDTCHNTESEGLTFIMHHIEDWGITLLSPTWYYDWGITFYNG